MRNSLSKFEAELDYIAVRARSGVPGVQCETFLAIERLLERGCPTFVIARSFGVEAPVGLEGNMEMQKNLTLARVEKVLAGIFTDSDGVIILKGRKYTTIDNLPGFLSAITGKRSAKPYESAIERAGLDFEEGLGIQGKICEFYCIEDVQGLL